MDGRIIFVIVLLLALLSMGGCQGDFGVHVGGAAFYPKEKDPTESRTAAQTQTAYQAATFQMGGMKGGE